MHFSIKIPAPALKKWTCIVGKSTHEGAHTTVTETPEDEDTFEEVANIDNEVEPLCDSDDEIPYPESPIVYNGGQYFDVEDYFYNNDGKYFEKSLRPEKKPKAPEPKADAYLLNELRIAVHGAKDPDVVKMENYLKEINKQPDTPLRSHQA